MLNMDTEFIDVRLSMLRREFAQEVGPGNPMQAHTLDTPELDHDEKILKDAFVNRLNTDVATIFERSRHRLTSSMKKLSADLVAEYFR